MIMNCGFIDQNLFKSVIKFLDSKILFKNKKWRHEGQTIIIKRMKKYLFPT